jgi:small redox-active disulfide protein 2
VHDVKIKSNNKMKIEIFGSGCSRCREAHKIIEEALGYLSLKAEIIKIEDVKEIAQRGILATPAIAINGEIKSAGRIPETRELHNWITTAAMKEDA